MNSPLGNLGILLAMMILMVGNGEATEWTALEEGRWLLGGKRKSNLFNLILIM
ncbi:hypothetical protein; putative exported protein [Xenorhabdus bovienii str. Jollieti]|uniref:Uncharacterized protein n=1 Tax=Xenorhabdus bovienii (strain SS-2004) TaxID=406818 RepID=D3V101_XENBS|nr:hypothetical protein; putative exported protein [Xenorhabdus bovienii SS-2004]CDH30543.1 hypothetical protein; putative exported protein [Xenorhabdus bovienii str. Jollieti]